MKRTLQWIGFVFVGVMTSAWAADSAVYEEGKSYQRAPKEVVEDAIVQDFKKEANNKVQVLEFFSYGCHWCFVLDPFVQEWEKTLPSDVNFQRVPVEFQPSWQTLGKAYYTALDLNALDKIHTPLFDAIQNNKMTSSSEDTLRQFFNQYGISAENFNKTFTSFDVDRRQKWANALSRGYRITAVPAMIVQGPTGTYIVTVRLAGSEENLIKVVNHLIKQEQSALSTHSE